MRKKKHMLITELSLSLWIEVPKKSLLSSENNQKNIESILVFF